MIAEFSIIPIGKGESLSPLVAEAFRIIEASRVPHEYHAMGTNLEGDWDDVMFVIKACRDRLMKHANRVSISIKIDDRATAPERLKAKVSSAQSKM